MKTSTYGRHAEDESLQLQTDTRAAVLTSASIQAFTQAAESFRGYDAAGAYPS